MRMMRQVKMWWRWRIMSGKSSENNVWLEPEVRFIGRSGGERCGEHCMKDKATVPLTLIHYLPTESFTQAKAVG